METKINCINLTDEFDSILDEFFNTLLKDKNAFLRKSYYDDRFAIVNISVPLPIMKTLWDNKGFTSAKYGKVSINKEVEHPESLHPSIRVTFNIEKTPILNNLEFWYTTNEGYGVYICDPYGEANEDLAQRIVRNKHVDIKDL